MIHSETKLRKKPIKDIGITFQGKNISKNILSLLIKFSMSKRKEILIIGNGRSVLDHLFGKQINKFSIVGRINNYSIDNYAEYVGEKTDIWFNGANQNLKRQKVIPNEVVVFIPPKILRRKKEKIHDRISRRLHIDKEKYSLIPLETMENYEILTGVKRPTTGTASILWAVENFEKVIIHGFDFFIDSKSHYNDNFITKWLIDWGINKKGGKHNMLAEKIYIEKLIKDKKVIQLKKYLRS